MWMLRRFSKKEFQKCYGKYFFFGASAMFMFGYFLTKSYRAIPDRRLRLHGEIITMTLCYAPIGIGLLLLLDELR
jgi:hypothetical protein